ncbi:NAD(P)-dependent alcohol dehydrogenase [Actinosynnema sp. NPDC047251]|uniref:Oxidoreductase, Zn-binding protein n=1 Tax=Saccharothrix espanaensis (strain ATCC 51144 / DSM 44229 / JCM 9112 / NBRC 15066 / NRRL 15764) TaxID=1179773 RepID=K3W490_SACES|nr:NAD(P)-dependent alcohol dehydrogenase [Saccharothrix espanaensis]CCH27537.1 Oxidoreductase, Zn-binding protein [Saccharothrix espanaensis DSM 44229]
MKAVVQERYGVPAEVLRLRDVAVPEVGAGEVLVRVGASPVSGTDWHLVLGLPYAARFVTGLRRPANLVFGLEFAGTVTAVGPGVPDRQVGDEVFGWHGGAFAEYISVPAGQMTRKPRNLSVEHAAAVPIASFTALQAVRDLGRVRPGQEVLISGASGCVGTYAVQIAKALGARVTGICGADKADLVRSLGADRVVDYREQRLRDVGERFDVLVDIYGNPSLADCGAVLKPGGTLVFVGGTGGRLFMGTDRWLRGLLVAPFRDFTVRALVHKDRHDDLVTMREFIESGAVTPVVGQVYGLDRVAEAIEDVRAGRVRGQAVVAL